MIEGRICELLKVVRSSGVLIAELFAYARRKIQELWGNLSDSAGTGKATLTSNGFEEEGFAGLAFKASLLRNSMKVPLRSLCSFAMLSRM